jgi:parallel beta-helix repeat protein
VIFSNSRYQATRLALATPLLLAFTIPASAATLCVNTAGNGGCKNTIAKAIAVAAPGDTIQVAQGTYTEQVTITKSLSLVAAPGAQPAIDASGKSNGIFIDGMATAPLPGVANVVISGFTIQNANYEGILVANASSVTLLSNHVLHNNKLLDATSGACPGIPAFETSEQMDCGEGIHLMSTDHATVLRNTVEENSGGILISDETGPNFDNLVKGNDVHDNAWACGITMASHPAANGGLPYGISHNVIDGNQSYDNGLGIATGAGAGVGIFAPFPGTASHANVITGNTLYGNGHPGVELHNHASAPAPAPGINLNDNIIVGNYIYGNAADSADAHTNGLTGINIYSTAPVTGTVIAQNKFDNEAINISFKVPAGSLDVHFNDFNNKGIGVQNLGTGIINATENYWDCPNLPYGYCATAAGAGIATIPALTQPFNLTA